MSWSIAQEKYNDKFYFRKNPVYKVENSLLINGYYRIMWFLFRNYLLITVLLQNRML